MKEYFVIFILFTIFILYSVTLVSKDLNRMRCIEGFEAPALTFLQAIEGHACSNEQKKLHYDHNIVTDTYQLQCYDQCSTDNTYIPVTTNGSNCRIPSDSNTSNCEVTVSAKCYLDGAFHEIRSNVNMYCPESGYADCAQCVVTQGDCSNVDHSCQRIDSVTLPTGYARCTLDSNLDNLTYLEGDSNVRFACDQVRCNSGGTGLSGRGDSLTRITDGSCSTLDCYGDAEHVSENSFKIDGRVLGIKIPANSIYIDTDGITKAKVQITLNNYRNVDSWENMSIGLCEGNNEINEPLTQETIQKVRSFFNTSIHKLQHERWRFGDNVCVETRPVPRHRHHECITFSNNPHTDSTIGKKSHNKSSEMLILNGGYYGIYFNFINGNNFVNYHHTDRYKKRQGENLFVNRRTNEITIKFDDGSMLWEGEQDKPDINDTLSTTTAYVFIKGLEGYTRHDIPEGRIVAFNFLPAG